MSGHGEKVFASLSKPLDSSFSDKEIARRRDELAKRMLNMPPHPLKPKRNDATSFDHKAKSRGDASPKKRGRPSVKKASP
jgi:hypothetical protein